MPVIEVDPNELRTLAEAPEKDEETLKDDLFSLGLEFEGWTDEEAFQLELAPDRLDRLSVEGVARSLRYQYGVDRGVHLPTVNRSNWTFEVESSVPADRPYVTGAIIRDVELDETTLGSLIQLQEKLHETMGRGRVKGAIGIHDLAMLKGGSATEGEDATISYRGISGDSAQFVPLESDEEMTPERVLTDHPTGRTYAHVVSEYERLPAIYDDLGLFSFPPVINGRRTEVTTDSRELLVELTGTEQWTIDKMLAIVCYALDARGATIESVTVESPEDTLTRPGLETKQKQVEHTQIEHALGIELGGEEVVDLFERSGLDAQRVEREEGLAYRVAIPPYRVDVLHPVDLIDDIGRAFGFNELEPRYPDVSTVGGRHEDSRFERAIRGLLVGLGFEDVLNFNLISEAENFDRMNVRPGDDCMGGGQPPRIGEPYSEAYEIVRTWALPSLLMVLENNTHRAYPQDLSEIGLATSIDSSFNTQVDEWQSVAAVLARTDASYEDAKAVLDAICRRLDLSLKTPPTEHPSFVDGRTASIDFGTGPVGVIGELHPAVLVEHDLEVPVTAFEFRLDGLQAAVDATHDGGDDV